MASAASMEAITPAAGAITPTVSQVSSDCGADCGRRAVSSTFFRSEKTGEARGDAGTNRHSDAVTSDGGSVNPRDGKFHGGVVQQMARFKIVCAVEN